MVIQRRLSRAMVFAWFFWVGSLPVVAQQGNFPPLEFKHGARIVFLGGSFFENELEDCYLEFAFTSRWPDRALTFRNLGWTGDNVYAEARSTFTTPPTPYQQLFQQIRSTRPDYVLIAYGTVEAQKGEAGVEEFTRGLEVIIDSVDALGAQTILLSTIPVRLAGTQENTLNLNKNLQLYRDAIARIASKRKKRFVDLYTPVSQSKAPIYAYNGIHLNAKGYYYVARLLEEAFGWPSRGETINLSAGEGNAPQGEPGAPPLTREGNRWKFSVQENLLPLPIPPSGEADPVISVQLRVSGLPAGRYLLAENGNELRTVSSGELEKGIALISTVSQSQAARLADSIAKKNNFFFQQYRPMNRTYILGFREYEQGRHKQGLQELDKFIDQLEAHIREQITPVKKTYELIPAK